MTDATVLVSKANKALAVPRTSGMMRLFPEGKPLDKLWVINHGLPEYMLLRRLGFAVPNPISCYYDWSAGDPFHIQKVTCSLLTASPRAYVLNAMGTGKTRATLWAWDYLHSNGYAGKLLVVAPLSTLWLVWAHEVHAALLHRSVQVLWGSKKQRLERLRNSNADIFVINHDGIKVILPELRQREDINVLVIDELATYRNNNDRSKTMLKFAERFKFVWGLTGSPMPNSPTDVWMQCKIITPHTVPKYLTHARDQLMYQRNEMWFPKPGAVEKAYSWMQPAVRFTLDDVIELPELVQRVVDVPMEKEHTRVYSTVAREFTVMIGNEQINAVNAAAAANKLLQISGGYVYSQTFGTVELDVTPRKMVLVDLIEQATGKVLVFFPFRHMVTGVSKYLGSLKDPIPHAVVHGDVPTGARNEIFKDFQPDTDEGKYKALLAHPGCMKHGLTLTSADTIIWYCPLADLEVYEQANARITRIGQKHRQQIIHLQSTPVERKLYALLRKKASIQDKLLSLFEDATTAANGEG